jgi:hypothetical protein
LSALRVRRCFTHHKHCFYAFGKCIFKRYNPATLCHTRRLHCDQTQGLYCGCNDKALEESSDTATRNVSHDLPTCRTVPQTSPTTCPILVTSTPRQATVMCRKFREIVSQTSISVPRTRVDEYSGNSFASSITLRITPQCNILSVC